jgi:hypothetical protein
MKLKFFRNFILRVKLPRFILQVLLVVSFSLNGCTPSSPSAEQLPERDIVFQTATLWGGGTDSRLGFINTDGSGLTYFQIAFKLSPDVEKLAVGSPIYPVITADNSTLVFRMVGMSGHPGSLALIRSGQHAIICPIEMGITRPSITSDQKQIVTDLVNPGGRLSLYDLGFCLSTAENNVGEVFDISIERYPTYGDLSPSKNRLVFQAIVDDSSVENPKYPGIFVRDLDTGNETLIGSGLAPAWSPDGEWIAFRGLDGIYLVRSNGEGMQLLVEYVSPEEGRSHEEWPPLPEWSPDGEWLAYHRCILDVGPQTDCSDTSNGINFSIFMVNVNTGQEIKVFDGGLNPYWRQMVSP